MLGYPEFHNDLIRKYTKLFGSLFTQLEVYRENTTGDPSLQKVPLTFAPKDKVLEFGEVQYGESTAAVATVSPRISYDFVGIQYDSSRRTGKFLPITLANGKTIRNYLPYNITYELNVVGKTESDCERVVEQILPFFDPSISVTVFPIPGDSSYSRDITITLNTIQKNDTYPGQADDRRVVNWTLMFTMQAFIFGPTSSTSSIIKKVIVNYNDLEHSEVWGGVDSSGNPTTDPDDAIDYKDVEPTDTFAIIEVFSHDQ